MIGQAQVDPALEVDTARVPEELEEFLLVLNARETAVGGQFDFRNNVLEILEYKIGVEVTLDTRDRLPVVILGQFPVIGTVVDPRQREIERLFREQIGIEQLHLDQELGFGRTVGAAQGSAAKNWAY